MSRAHIGAAYLSTPRKRRKPSEYDTSGWNSDRVYLNRVMSRARERTVCSTAGEDVHTKSLQYSVSRSSMVMSAADCGDNGTGARTKICRVTSKNASLSTASAVQAYASSVH